MQYSVVIPAAGQGKRMNAGRNKQFLKLDGKEVLAHTMAHFEQDPRCRDVIIVANEKELSHLHVLKDMYHWAKVHRIIAGGKERQDSVYEGLKQCQHEGVVLIHDGARPFITEEMIGRLLQIVADTNEGAVSAVPVKDTIKRVVDRDVEETMDRKSLWAVQTPQAFPLSLIKQAYVEAEAKGIVGTDDASLVEAMGQTVHVVEGDYRNIKLTTPDDLIFAKAIIDERKEGKACSE